MTRKIYLDDIPLDEARRRLADALMLVKLWQPFDGEAVPLPDALGRVTAEAVWAKISAPHYHASAMDGYAVRAEATAGASDTTPVRLPLDGVQARALDTGDPLPNWANAVIPIENVQLLEGSEPPQLELRAAVSPWTHVRAMGEDMVATELVLPANHRLRPVDLGAIAGSGHSVVMVRRKPRVAVIPTGTELVPAGSPVKPGDIIEYNSLVLAAQIDSWGGIPTRYPIVPDQFDQIADTVRQAAHSHDLILLNAGSSAGSEDFSARVVQSVGTLLVHGVAVRPGHPVILGMVQASDSHSVPIVGVPGYPVSAALTGEIFVEPLLARWLGQPASTSATVEATISRKVLSPMGDDEYMRVTVGNVGGHWVATPLARGAGVITSLVRADGIVRIPRLSEGVQAGEKVIVHLYRPLTALQNTLVAIGSHDLTLDLLGQFIAERSPGSRLASANVGSLGGLIALKRGEAHIAGTHLLDPESGEYNLSYIERYAPGLPMVLVRVVRREQGLLVAKGNPKNIGQLSDLARSDIQFVNRQRGAGTRVLLDYELGKLNLKPDSIRGYAREEFTHLAVAAAVASGVADCGLGIHSAAAALDLRFVPLFHEPYELAIPQHVFESDLIQPLLATLMDDPFQRAVSELPGYDVTGMGEVRARVL